MWFSPLDSPGNLVFETQFCTLGRGNHSIYINNRPVKRLALVARLAPVFYIVPHAGWNYGIVSDAVFITQNWWDVR